MITQGAILTVEQKNLIEGKTIVHDWYYSPQQDINSDWYVGEYEIKITIKPEFMFLKSLPIVTITIPDPEEP
jgi:hypothetical protein